MYCYNPVMRDLSTDMWSWQPMDLFTVAGMGKHICNKNINFFYNLLKRFYFGSSEPPH